MSFKRIWLEFLTVFLFYINRDFTTLWERIFGCWTLSNSFSIFTIYAKQTKNDSTLITSTKEAQAHRIVEEKNRKKRRFELRQSKKKESNPYLFLSPVSPSFFLQSAMIRVKLLELIRENDDESMESQIHEAKANPRQCWTGIRTPKMCWWRIWTCLVMRPSTSSDEKANSWLSCWSCVFLGESRMRRESDPENWNLPSRLKEQRHGGTFEHWRNNFL